MNQATGIPESVLKQGKVADEVIAQIAKGEAVTVIEEEGLVGDETAAPVKKAEPAKKPEAREATEETWQGRYTALKGKYDAEVPRLAEELAELRETAKRQQSTIDTLLKTVDSSGGRTPEPDREIIDEAGKAPTHSKGFSKKVNKDNFAGYGGEVLEMVDVVNTQNDEIKTLKDELAQIKGTVQATTKNAFLDGVARLCPHWAKLDKDAKFLKWLAEKETPRSKETRQEALDYYVGQQDASSVAAFFNDYISEVGWKPDGSGKGAMGRQADLEQEIVPAPDVALQSSESAKRLGFPVVTRDQLAKATRDRVAGKITDEEYNKIADNYQRTYAAVRAGKLTL